MCLPLLVRISSIIVWKSCFSFIKCWSGHVRIDVGSIQVDHYKKDMKALERAQKIVYIEVG